MILVWLVAAMVVLFGFVVAFGAPYVPSHVREVRRSFKELYEVGSEDVVVDLGAGDGRVIHEAVRLGAAAYGVELNPLLVLFMKLRLLGTPRAHVTLGDMWQYRLPADTTLVYIFSVSRDGAKSARRLQREANRLGRPFHVMMYGSTLDGPEPTATLRGHTLYTMTPLQGKEA